MQLAVTLTTEQTFGIHSVIQVDANDVALPTPDPTYGAPTYSSSDDTVVTVGQTLQGPVVSPTGKLGTATITVTEVSSTGEPTIIGTLVVTVTGPAAASLEIEGAVA